jgi:hypothetical protein
MASKEQVHPTMIEFSGLNDDYLAVSLALARYSIQ